MLRYNWQGVNHLGEPQQGQLLAKTILDARLQLRRQNIITRRISKVREPVFLKRDINRALSLCLQQIASSLFSGMPIVPTLEAMASHQPNPTLKYFLTRLQQDLQNGVSFSEALAQHPHLFQVFICQWVNMGEQSGTLPTTLQHIAGYFKAQHAFKQRIRKALTYPITVLCMASMVVVALMVVVVPQFESFYQYIAATMPWPTRCLLSVSRATQQYGAIGILCFVALLFIAKLAYQKNPQWREYVERSLLAIPLLGHILQQSAFARMIQTLSTAYLSGLSLLDAFHATRFVTGYSLYAEKIRVICDLLASGEPLRTALLQSQLFGPFVLHLFCLSEETGTLKAVLPHILSHYEDAVHEGIHRFTTVFEPLLMALLGVGIGGIILALYLPILNLGALL